MKQKVYNFFIYIQFVLTSSVKFEVKIIIKSAKD